MAEIRLVGVTKKFGENTAVDRIDLTARDKEFIVLVGPSGCGKTTTLRMIAGLEEVSEGEIFNISLIDINGDPVDAFVLFLAPFHIPRFKYGNNIKLVAPIIWNGAVKKLNAKIFVFKIQGLRIEFTNMTILN